MLTANTTPRRFGNTGEVLGPDFYRTEDLVHAVPGATYRIVDHAIRRGKIGPDVSAKAPGSGSARVWSPEKFAKDVDYLNRWIEWRNSQP